MLVFVVCSPERRYLTLRLCGCSGTYVARSFLARDYPPLTFFSRSLHLSLDRGHFSLSHFLLGHFSLSRGSLGRCRVRPLA